MKLRLGFFFEPPGTTRYLMKFPPLLRTEKTRRDKVLLIPEHSIRDKSESHAGNAQPRFLSCPGDYILTGAVFLQYTDEITSTCSRRTSQDENQKVTRSLDHKLKSQYSVKKTQLLVDGVVDELTDG